MGDYTMNRVSGNMMIDNRLKMKSGFLDLDQLRSASFSNPLNLSSKSQQMSAAGGRASKRGQYNQDGTSKRKADDDEDAEADLKLV